MSNKLKRGCSIALEGNEATGKTTMAKRLVEYYNSIGIEAEYIKEPGGTELAEKIRNLILYNDMDKLTELLLFYAARNVNMENNILPGLEAGKLLIMDRFIDCTHVYQGVVGGNSLFYIKLLNDMVVRRGAFYKMPFYRILIDCSVNTVVSRLDNEGREHNKYDTPDRERLQRIQEEYYKYFKSMQETDDTSAAIVFGECTQDELFSNLVSTIDWYLSRKDLLQ